MQRLRFNPQQCQIIKIKKIIIGRIVSVGKDLLSKCEDMSWDPQNLKLKSVCL